MDHVIDIRGVRTCPLYNSLTCRQIVVSKQSRQFSQLHNTYPTITQLAQDTMKLMIILAACSVGVVLGNPVEGTDTIKVARDCYNRDDARHDALEAGCQNVDPSSHAGTYCNTFGCNCDWGCMEPTQYDEEGDVVTSLWHKNKCPAKLVNA
jgi:hypothetical protein